MGLKRGENVLDYLIDLNEKQPIRDMNLMETEQVLRALGWIKEREYEKARHKLLGLVSFFESMHEKASI